MADPSRLSNSALAVWSPSRSPGLAPRPRRRFDNSMSSFTAALKGVDRKLSTRFENLRTAGLPDLTEVLRVTEEIGNRCMERHGGWRDYAIRIIPFLNRLREFAPIGDVIVGGAQNLAVSGVWAAVRLALEVSLSSIDFFDRVSEMMFRIGKSVLLNRDFATIFPQNDELQDLAYEYLAIVVDMATKIVHYAQKSTFSQVASSLLSSFDSTFKPLESQLQETSLQIQARTEILAIQKNQDSHLETQSLLSTIHLAASRERRNIALETEKRRVLNVLCPDQGKFDITYRYHRRRAHSAWIFEQTAYRSWEAATYSSVLCLRGNLGSGKSVIMASAVANLAQNIENTMLETISREDSPTTISYFFCTSRGLKSTASAILGSIAYQALVSTALSSFFSQYLHLNGGALEIRCEPQACVDLLLNATPKDWNGFIIIDGLDDCFGEDVEVLFEELERLSQSRNIHLLCSSRTLWEHFNKMNYVFGGSTLSIAIEDVDRSSEVVSYISANLEQWKGRFGLTQKSASLLQEQLWIGWGGMYLWLALQMAGITEDLDSSIPVGDIISNLPRNLPEAYDKALLRIHDKPVASRIFKLAIATESPLSFHELQVAADILPGKPEWMSMRRPAQVSVYLRQYGGHLLEADEDQKICFIHHSAVLHLLDSPVDPNAREFHFSLLDAKQHLGLVCVTYLNLPDLDRTVSNHKQPLNLGEADIPGAVVDSIAKSHSRLKTAFRFLPGKQRAKTSSIQVDRLHAYLKIQQQQPVTSIEVGVLLEYVKANWLKATRFLHLSDPNIYRCWKRILDGRVGVITVPVQLHEKEESYIWAMFNGHYAVLRFLALENSFRTHARQMFQTLSDILSSRPGEIQIFGAALLPAVVGRIDYGVPESFPRHLLGQRVFNPLASEFKYDDLEVSIALAEVRSLAPVLMQVLLMYTGENFSPASILLSYVAGLVHPNTDLHDGMTAAQLAKKHRSPTEFLKILYQHGHTETNDFSLQTARVEKLSGEKPLPLSSMQALNLATLDANTECVKFLLEHGVDVLHEDNRNRTALIHAAKKGRGYTECTRLLLRHGAKVNHQDALERAALHYATIDGNVETVRILLDHGADLHYRDKQGLTALMHATNRENLACFKVLSKFKDKNIKERLKDRSEALKLASIAGRVDYVHQLLDLGADIDFQANPRHKTALMCAVENDNPGVVATLIEREADVHVRSRQGRTALHIGVEAKSERALIVLLKKAKQINLDAQDDTYNTALHYACDSVEISLIRLLVKNNANIDIFNDSKRTPLDVLTRARTSKRKSKLDHDEGMELLRLLDGRHC